MPSCVRPARQVREAISILDLDVDVRPTPKDGKVWRPKAVQLGGKAQFPFLVDPNTGGWQLHQEQHALNTIHRHKQRCGSECCSGVACI